MKRNYTNEEFNVEEYQQVDEFVVFRSEEYRGKEIIDIKQEEFIVDEIKKDIPEEKLEFKGKIKDNTEFIKKHMTSSSITSTVSSIGATGVFVATVAVGGGIIFDEIVNYGSLEPLNYYVDYYMENEQLLSNVIVYVENQLENGYSFVINNPDLDIEIYENSFAIKGLPLDEHNISVCVLDEKEKIVEDIPFNINTISPIPYMFNLEMDYLITDNEDSYNIYIHPLLDDKSLEIETFAYFVDDQGNVVGDYVSIGGIENIPYDKEDFLFVARTNYEGNYYSIGETRLLDINPKELNYEISVIQNQLSIVFDKEIAGDIEVDVTFVDSGNTQKIIIDGDIYAGRKEAVVTLDELSSQIELIVLGQFLIKDFTTPTKEFDYQGNKTILHNINTLIECELNTELSVYGFEHTPETNYNQALTRLVLEGYLKPNDIIKVSVLDSSNTEIDVLDDLTSLDNITFYGLTGIEDVTFKIEVYDSAKTNVLFEDSVVYNLVIPTEFEELPYSSSSFNPNDAYLTYNDNGTFNAYFYSAFENETEYDIFFRTTLESESGVLRRDTRGEVIAFEDLNPNENYALTSQVMVRDGVNVYSISPLNIPSGSISHSINEDGIYDHYFIYGAQETVQGSGIINVSFYEEPVQNITFNITLMNKTEIVEELEIVVPLEELSVDEYDYINCSIDLSSYTFDEALIVAKTTIKLSNYNETLILENSDSIKGEPYFQCQSSITFYKEG